MNPTHQRLCSWLSDPPPSGLPDEHVIALAESEGVLLLLADRCGMGTLMPALRAAAVMEELHARELRAVLTLLSGEGICPVILKGAALARTHYRRPELRPRSDTDFMIPEDAREHAARVLARLAYQRAPEIDGDLAVGQFHVSKTDRHGVSHALDVHWRVSNVRVFADALSYQELRRDAVSVADLGPHAWAPSPPHALLIACIHRVAHHDDTRHLLWLFDVHLLARSLAFRQCEAFTALATTTRMRAVCASTLRLSQEAFGGLDGEWISRLSREDGVHEPSRAFVGGGWRRAEILLSDVTATPGWTGRLLLLREHLLPRLSYMRARYPAWPAAFLPAAYVHRVLCGLPRWLRRGAAGTPAND